jgi:integrase
MEQRGLAASTIDRRLSTVCGFYRFAHIDGRIASNPAQYVRRPKVPPTDGHGMDRGELGTFLFTAERFDRAHAARAVLLGLNGLRVSEACATNVEDLGFQRGHRTLQIVGKGNKPATIPLVPRTARTIDLAIGERHEGPIVRRRDNQRLTVAPPTAGSGRSADERVSAPPFTHTCCAPGSSWPPSTPASRYETSRSPPATPTHARQPSTTGDERMGVLTCFGPT